MQPGRHFSDVSPPTMCSRWNTRRAPAPTCDSHFLCVLKKRICGTVPPPPSPPLDRQPHAANWFIAWESGWVPARTLQLEAIAAFFEEDGPSKIRVSDGGFYKFKSIGSSMQQHDQRYAIQDRMRNGLFREVSFFKPGTVVAD